MNVNLLHASPVSLAGRGYGICTDRGTIPIENVKRWTALGHESPLEHVVFTFEVTGISRACATQLVRHRIASYSQESMRYVDMSAPEFVMPPSIQENVAARAYWIWFTEGVGDVYRDLRAQGIPAEDARFILPLATTTDILVTMNARALRNFLRQRLQPAAQWEIRDLAWAMLELAYAHFPEAFEDIVSEYEVDNDRD